MYLYHKIRYFDTLPSVDCEIRASGTRPKERRQSPGLSGKFQGTRRIFIERPLGKRRPEDPSRTPRQNSVRLLTINLRKSVKSREQLRRAEVVQQNGGKKLKPCRYVHSKGHGFVLPKFKMFGRIAFELMDEDTAPNKGF
jgi:hypothetical protein